MIREIKIKNKADFPNGQWVKIAYEKDEGKVDDEEIYFYVENDFDLRDLRVGDKIQLDEEFEIIEVEPLMKKFEFHSIIEYIDNETQENREFTLSATIVEENEKKAIQEILNNLGLHIDVFSLIDEKGNKFTEEDF